MEGDFNSSIFYNLSDFKFTVWALVTVAVAWINNKSNKKEEDTK